MRALRQRWSEYPSRPSRQCPWVGIAATGGIPELDASADPEGGAALGGGHRAFVRRAGDDVGTFLAAEAQLDGQAPTKIHRQGSRGADGQSGDTEVQGDIGIRLRILGGTGGVGIRFTTHAEDEANPQILEVVDAFGAVTGAGGAFIRHHVDARHAVGDEGLAIGSEGVPDQALQLRFNVRDGHRLNLLNDIYQGFHDLPVDNLRGIADLFQTAPHQGQTLRRLEAVGDIFQHRRQRCQ